MQLVNFVSCCEPVYTQTGRYPRSVRSDQGGEYVNNEWTTRCTEKGIIHETTAAYSPESNGIAERANLTLANMCRPALVRPPTWPVRRKPLIGRPTSKTGYIILL
jgi:transposase InsO family protein